MVERKREGELGENVRLVRAQRAAAQHSERTTGCGKQQPGAIARHHIIPFCLWGRALKKAWEKNARLTRLGEHLNSGDVVSRSKGDCDMGTEARRRR